MPLDGQEIRPSSILVGHKTCPTSQNPLDGDQFRPPSQNYSCPPSFKHLGRHKTFPNTKDLIRQMVQMLYIPSQASVHLKINYKKKNLIWQSNATEGQAIPNKLEPEGSKLRL